MIRSVLFFGTRCSFADRVADELIQNGFQIAARLVPGYAQANRPFQDLTAPGAHGASWRLPMVRPRSSGTDEPFQNPDPFPTIMIHQHRSLETVDCLRGFGADIAVVCCYPARLPMSLVDTTQHGGINVHPSLLPRFRGPEPLFWIFRNGDLETGVTLHRVDAGLDTGAIIKQQRINIPIGIPGNQLWNESASIGASMLVEVLRVDDWSRIVSRLVPQSGEDASYQSWPQQSDLIIDPATWEAWHVYHFCRGVIPLGYAPVLIQDGVTRQVLEVTCYVKSKVAGRSSDGWINCLSGAVKLTLGDIVPGSG